MPANPSRGEIWRVNFDPTVGAEIRKIRPAVVISLDTIGKLDLRLIVPLTEWKDGYRAASWMVRVDPTPENGLHKPSTADTFQMRSASTLRFIEKIGALSPSGLRQIAAAVALIVDF